MKLIVKRTTVGRTIELLKIAGHQSDERMVLWMGRHEGNSVVIEDLLLPRQKVTRVSIRILPSGMRQIFDEMRSTGRMVAAQVHSHPEEAFHSYTDDCLAITRHEGAISLVLPNFALDTNVDSFHRNAVCFRLSKNNEWELTDISENLEMR